ncbi:MAG TPA: hypothetical protein VMU85_13805 [Stellaceae bacterium]|nr:hypothetical protein [Stellaceae bacterium]
MISTTGDRSGNAERLLLDYVERLARHAEGRRAVVIHLSRLRPGNRLSHHIRIAVNTFEALVKQFDGQIFLLANADIVFVCKSATIAALDDAVMRVRYLFSEDPLASGAEDEPGGFATWFDLTYQYDGFLALARGLVEEDLRRRKRHEAIAASGERVAEKPPLAPKLLGELVNAIAQADLSNMLRRQVVCLLEPGGPPRSLFHETYISIADLAVAVMPRYDLAADRWLFRYLTQTLDRRMLAMLRRGQERITASPFSLNLNVATLLSTEFLDFDAGLKSGARGSIVVELDKTDIYSDIGAYLFARDFARERGYRICLDGATDLTLPFIDRERLGLDLVKVFWSPDMADAAHAARAQAFRENVERVGRTRVILARCDSEAAVRFGLTLGISSFQGRFLDRLPALRAVTDPPRPRSPGGDVGVTIIPPPPRVRQG